MRKPTVLTRCVANLYTKDRPHERIIEFNDREREGCGGLISFRRREDGTLLVEIYRADDKVRVRADPKLIEAGTILPWISQ